MPKRQHIQVGRDANGTGGIRISGAALTIIGTLFALIVGVWQIAGRIATKSDVEAIAIQMGPRLTQTEARIRDLELQNAAHWGASPVANRPGVYEETPVQRAGFVLAQYQQVPFNAQQGAPPPIPQRSPVLSIDFLRAYQMQPSRGGYYPLLGADGRLYALDDWVEVMTQLHMSDIRQQLQRIK